MRVAHFISGIDARAGGPAVAVAGLVTAQRRAGIEVALVACAKIGYGQDLSAGLSDAGATVGVLHDCRGPLMRHPRLAGVVDAAVADADVVHIHGLWEQIQHDAARAAQQRNKPYLFTAHGMLTRWSMGQKALKKRMYLAWRLRGDLRGAAAIHYTSGAERDDLSAHVKVDRPALIEPLGVDLGEFASLPPRGTFRAKFGETAGKKIVLFLGRIHRGKGLEYLVPAFAGAKLNDAILVAVGPDSGGFRGEIERLAERHAVRGRMLFTGMLRGRQRLEALVDADLFALPSEHENFGIVVVEALACGVPVIVSDGVAIHGEIADARVGGVVRARDVAALTRILKQWIQDDALRAAASAGARQLVQRRFDWNAIAQRWTDHYRRLIDHEART